MKLIGSVFAEGVPLSVFDDIIATMLYFVLHFGWLPYGTPPKIPSGKLLVSNINKPFPQPVWFLFLILYFIYSK